MATDTRFVVQNITDTTTFRAWGAATNAIFAACGMVQTADTGQINWTTVAWVNTGNTNYGYEVWRLNDSLQSTKPWFLRVDYSSAAAQPTVPTFNLSAGTATNGAGTLSGTTTGSISTGAGNAHSATIYSSGNGSRIMMQDPTGTTSGWWFTFERAQDGSGNYTGDGIVLTGSRGSGTPTLYYTTPTVSNSVLVGNAVLPIGNLTMTGSASDICILPVILPFNGVWRYTTMLYSKLTDLSAGSVFTTTVAGTHTYLVATTATLTLGPTNVAMGFVFE